MTASKNFSIAELRCKCGCSGHLGPPIAGNLLRLAATLETLRTLAGNRPVRVNCAYRCPRHNDEVGGGKDSQHLQGLAADITIDRMLPAEVQMVAAKVPAIGGIGKYKTFTHIDCRNRIAGNQTTWVG